MAGNVKLWNDLYNWATANAAALRLCFRMAVAGLLAYVLAESFALPQGYWAVFSAIIIVQASVGGSIKATTDRLIGTISGAVAGGAVAYLLPQTSVLSLGVALVIALVPLTLVAALWPNYRIASLTAVIVLLTPGAQQLGPLELGVTSHCRNYACWCCSALRSSLSRGGGSWRGGRDAV